MYKMTNDPRVKRSAYDVPKVDTSDDLCWWCEEILWRSVMTVVAWFGGCV